MIGSLKGKRLRIQKKRINTPSYRQKGVPGVDKASSNADIRMPGYGRSLPERVSSVASHGKSSSKTTYGDRYATYII